MQSAAKILIVTGVILIIAGIAIWLLSDKLHWFGNLPGDIKIKRENITIYAPIMTFLLISLALTIIVNIIKRFF